MFYTQTIVQERTKDIFDLDSFHELSKLDCFSIVNSEHVLNENPRLKQWMQFENFIIFGTGGSSLGGQCIHAIAKNAQRVHFANNLDTYSLEHLFSSIDMSRTGFLCISKSGETLETICQTLMAIDRIKDLDNISERVVIITENKVSSLREIASKFKFLCLDHPNTIGGRFSVFSIVGMLPAMLCGIDPTRIRAGGRQVLDDFNQSTSEVKKGASFVFNNFGVGKTEHISFIYSDKLSCFGDWLAQLYAESTGKDGIGITPIKAIGSVDQHSQLQLYLDGTRNKHFTFFVEQQQTNFPVFENNLPTRFKYLRNKSLSDIFSAQSTATLTSIVERKYDTRLFEFAEVTPEILGALFMHFMLEVACVCKLMEVNPFNQPAVERGKIITKSLLDELYDD